MNLFQLLIQKSNMNHRFLIKPGSRLYLLKVFDGFFFAGLLVKGNADNIMEIGTFRSALQHTFKGDNRSIVFILLHIELNHRSDDFLLRQTPGPQIFENFGGFLGHPLLVVIRSQF